jgi:hypothetical protein
VSLVLSLRRNEALVEVQGFLVGIQGKAGLVEISGWTGALTDELGGTAGSGSEVEAKSYEGPGLKPREFPEMENHSSRLAKGEERDGRLLGLCPWSIRP